MDCKSIFLISVMCSLELVQFSESAQGKNRHIRSAFCGWIKTNRCLMKIGSYSGSTIRTKVSIDGAYTTDPATRFTIVTIKNSSGMKRGKCIQFSTNSKVKYALRVVTMSNIIFEKQQNGCHDNISDDFVFKESRIRSKNSFTYTYNSKCLAARKDGTLFLKTTNDPSNEQQCKYTHLRYT
ncbi:uncharacterized protein [Pocillopora verrucosa]|uniref:uncharacterized protein n=1 Tax=Pocillopora verrucosa TaxID=203993 RepID=UPI00333F3703